MVIIIAITIITNNARPMKNEKDANVTAGPDPDPATVQKQWMQMIPYLLLLPTMLLFH